MVEDSPTDAELAVRAFQRAKIGNQLRVVSSGEEALDYLLGTGAALKRGVTQPLLILLDVHLVGMSGIDFLRQIKADERTAGIPVVSLSITKASYEIIKCIQLGVIDHIVKPVGYPALIGLAKRLKLKLSRLAADPYRARKRSSGGKAERRS